MTDIQQPADAREAVFWLPGPMWGKPRATAMLWGWLNQVNDIKKAFWDIVLQCDIDTCNLHHLKTWGKVVGERYAGQGTEDYRLLVKGRIFKNRTSGRIGEIFELLEIFAPAVSWDLRQWPRRIEILQTSLAVDVVWSPEGLATALRGIQAAGIAASVLLWPAGALNVIDFYSEDFSPPADELAWLGDEYGPATDGNVLVSEYML